MCSGITALSDRSFVRILLFSAALKLVLAVSNDQVGHYLCVTFEMVRMITLSECLAYSSFRAYRQKRQRNRSDVGHGAVHLLASGLDGEVASSLPVPRRLDSPAAWQQAQQQYVARLNVLSEERTHYNAEVIRLTAKSEKHKAQAAKLRATVSELRDELDSSRKQLEECRAELEQYKAYKSSLDNSVGQVIPSLAENAPGH